MIRLPKEVSFILEELNRHHYEAFIVGGCVRDRLMGKTPYDFDITTDALPQEIKGIFKKTYDTGLQHGTVTVCIDKINFEITTYRIDGTYTDGRRPDSVSFTKQIEEDLSRRDFTMNAIAYHPTEGFVDFFEGQADIERKLIRAVGIAEKRFQEDGLRMLRAIRFATQLGFDIDRDTWLALQQNAYLIKQISCERIYAEFSKILLSEDIEKVSLLWESGLLELIVEGSDIYMARYAKTIIASLLKCKASVSLRLALLMQYSTVETVENILKKLKVDNKTRKEVGVLVNNLSREFCPDAYTIRKVLSELGVTAFQDLLYLKQCIGNSVEEIEVHLDNILQQKDCIHLREMNITGEDLKRIGVNNGKEIGLLLQQLFEQVLHEPKKNNRDELLYEAEQLRNSLGHARTELHRH